MSPTVLRYKNYRFFFFSKEETRMHIHVMSPDGEAKFWLEPIIALADYHCYNDRQIKELSKIVEKNAEKFKKAWKNHFQIS